MHFRHVLLYEYKKGNNATCGLKNICSAYGEHSLSERTCRKWFKRFRKANFNLCDESRPGRSSENNEESIQGQLSKNARQSTAELAKALEIPKYLVRCQTSLIFHSFIKFQTLGCDRLVWIAILSCV